MADSGIGGADELSDELLAVSIRSASKGFGFAKRRSNILRSLDMAVKKGTMYKLHLQLQSAIGMIETNQFSHFFFFFFKIQLRTFRGEWMREDDFTQLYRRPL